MDNEKDAWMKMITKNGLCEKQNNQVVTKAPASHKKSDAGKIQRPLLNEKTDAAKLGDEYWEKENLRYGWGGFKPDCIQMFNTIRWYVFWVCVFSLFQGFIVNGVINAVITTLEKRYDLPSSKSGLIASSNDFFAFFLVLVISFYGSDRHKPKLIGIGVLVLGLGSFVFSLPQFFTGKYDFRGSDLEDFENVCKPGNATDTCAVASPYQQTSQQKMSSLSNYLYLFMLANALHGAGSTPMFTLGTSFIDENSRAEETPFFLGIIYCLASLGVAGGYIGGGQFLNIYVDAVTVATENIGITPMDPRWVGAWWIPFLISGTVMLIVVVPILGYPKQLPGSAKLQQERKSEASQAVANRKEQIGRDWRQFPRAMFNLVRNPTFLFLTLSACMEGMIISGVATFGGKFLQEKFNLPAAFASFVMGLITVPGAGGGMLLGGFIVKRGKLKCRGIIRLNMVCATLGLLISAVFWLQCPTQSIAGVSTDYVTGSPRATPVDLVSTCNVECGCSARTYEPVCGMDGNIYFTPCHAGCNGHFALMQGPMGPYKMYTNCSCVDEGLSYQNNMTPSSSSATTMVTTVITSITDSNENATGLAMGASQGVCMSDCQLLYVVAPLLFVGMMLTFMTCSPTQTATMRCVQENQRSIAIGLQWLFLRLLGTTPGPLMLGTIMDNACFVWQEVCGQQGNCWIYEKTSMGVKLFVWWIIVKVVSLCFNFAAQYFYKPPDISPNVTDEEEKSLTSSEQEIRVSVI
ncbi:hypothetical protein DPMN_185335 [Dreissena polymorpha]|uniref:Solute carrier organic anion transporter family member n=2 Tax=Dreissena polymorpha TaxID=45954 RepID=A0A9D4DKA5_DREPO|nr:hypothetical protein DPMN_185335 [Dreissena polymorpha]